MTDASNELDAALRSGDPWGIGLAQLDACFARLEGESADGEQGAFTAALSFADQAIDTFTSIPFPGGMALAHLAKATIFTDMARMEDDELRKAGAVERALDACLDAQSALEAEGVHAGQAFDIYASVAAVLLQLRPLIDEAAYQEAIDDLIEQNARALGEIVADDVQLREEGSAMLFTAGVLGALADLEDDEQARKEILVAQEGLALQAERWLEPTSDFSLLERAQEVAARARTEHDAAEKKKQDPGGEKVCAHCGFSNHPDKSFCTQCGNSLKLTDKPPDSGFAKRICPACGLENSVDKRFCTECGRGLGGGG